MKGMLGAGGWGFPLHRLDEGDFECVEMKFSSS